MFWRKEEIELQFPEREWLLSATKDCYFAASIRGTFKPGRRTHQDLLGLVRSEVLNIASEAAGRWEADQWCAAQDAINSVLGVPCNCSRGFYRRRIAQVRLIPDKDAAKEAVQIRVDRARISRLNYLKAALYSDPTLLAVAYLENHFDKIDNVNFDQFRRLSDKLHAGESWWGPLMLAWNELASKADSHEAIKESMNVLLEAIYRLDSKLATRHNLPAPEERDREKAESPNGDKSSVSGDDM